MKALFGFHGERSGTGRRNTALGGAPSPPEGSQRNCVKGQD